MNSDQTPEEKLKETEIENNKKFDYAENQTKKWISLLLNKSTKQLFGDDCDEDFISIQEGNNYYNLKLEAHSDSTSRFNIPREIFNTSNNLKKAVLSLFKAVYIVYTPILNTMLHERDSMDNIFPKFDETKMLFYFEMVNDLEIKRNNIKSEIEKCNHEINRTNMIKRTAENNQKIEEIKLQLAEYLFKKTDELEAITQKQIDDNALMIKEKNKKLLKSARLCITTKCNATTINESLKRLPVFGNIREYKDPNEESLTDMITKLNSTTDMSKPLFPTQDE